MLPLLHGDDSLISFVRRMQKVERNSIGPQLLFHRLIPPNFPQATGVRSLSSAPSSSAPSLLPPPSSSSSPRQEEKKRGAAVVEVKQAGEGKIDPTNYWDQEVSRFSLPPGVLLLLGDVQGIHITLVLYLSLASQTRFSWVSGMC